METKVTKKAPNILNIMAAKYNLDPVKFKETIKATIMRPGKDGRVATDEELMAFLIVANKYNLDPFTNEIYAFPAKRGGIIPVIGVDGFVRKICNHTDFNGMEISFAEEEVTPEGGKPCPEWCEIKLYRKGVDRPIIVREYIDEVYCPPKGGYPGPWQSHTKRMLRHKTIIQAGRVAGFLVGVYDEDEAARIIEAESLPFTGKPETAAPQAIENKNEDPDTILTILQAKEVPAMQPFNVSGQLVSIKPEKVGKNAKEITRYIITNDVNDETQYLKVSKWGKPMEGLQNNDKVIFSKVIGTIYNNEMQYLAEIIEPDMRGAVSEEQE